MPMPVSETANRRKGGRSGRDKHAASRVMPPWVVNLSAFHSRFMSTWRSRSGSTSSRSGSVSARWTRKTSPLLSILKRTTSPISRSRPGRSTATGRRSSVSASMRDRSRISVTRRKRIWQALSIVSRKVWRSPVGGAWRNISAMPTMTFKGVRISWLMLARKTHFSRFSVMARSRALTRDCSRSLRVVMSRTATRHRDRLCSVKTTPWISAGNWVPSRRRATPSRLKLPGRTLSQMAASASGGNKTSMWVIFMPSRSRAS